MILDELGTYIQSGGRYLSSAAALKNYYPGQNIHTLQDVEALPIVKIDEAAEKLTANRKRTAALQGAGTGVGGIFTLTIDIPLLLGIQLKTLQDIAICYGFDPADKNERMFIVKILQFVSSDIVGKKPFCSSLPCLALKKKDRRGKSFLSFKAGERLCFRTGTK